MEVPETLEMIDFLLKGIYSRKSREWRGAKRDGKQETDKVTSTLTNISGMKSCNYNKEEFLSLALRMYRWLQKTEANVRFNKDKVFRLTW